VLRVEPRKGDQLFDAGLTVVDQQRALAARGHMAIFIGDLDGGEDQKKLVVLHAPTVDEALFARRVRRDALLDILLAPRGEAGGALAVITIARRQQGCADD
jgi:hypothetical protein